MTVLGVGDVLQPVVNDMASSAARAQGEFNEDRGMISGRGRWPTFVAIGAVGTAVFRN